MKRLLCAVAFCLVGLQCLAGTLPLGPGSIFPIGPSNEAAAPGNPKFYVDAINGSDSNNGTTPALAWKTITHVNAQTFAANATISFHGSQTFSGGIVFTAANASGPTVNVYGAGQAVISSGNSAACVSATDVPGLTVSPNIVCTGGGNLTNTTAGISVINDQAGNTKLVGPTISGVTVSGYGYNGISIQGSSGSSGFNGVTIANNIITNVTGNSTDSFGTSCIQVFSKTGYGSGITAPSHTNVSITGNTVSNCTGTVGSTNWTGSGITVFQTSNFTISNNIAHDYGNNSTSPGGIWTADATNCIISYNLVYSGFGSTQNSFDLDGGVTNCVVEYNKAISNQAGVDYAAEQYFDGTCCAAWGNNTFRFNLGQNAVVSEFIVNFLTAATGPLNVYRNTFVNSVISSNLITQASGSAAVTGTFANNILVAGSGGNLISLAHPSSISFYGNDYYTYGEGVNFAWNGTNYTSFASWQSATGQEKISGSNVGLTVNPEIYVPGGLFVTADYVPTQDMADNLQAGSPMIGGGVNLQSQFGFALGGQDYYGAAVAANSQTVGAAEGDFAIFVASCTPTTNFLARVSSFTKLDNVNYNSLLCGLNDGGQLSLLDALYMLAAPNSAASLLNLVSTSFSLVAHNSPTFTARAGYTGNGTSSYLDTQFTPPGTNFTQNSATFAVYDLTVLGSEGEAMGNNSTGGIYNDIEPWDGALGTFYGINEGGSGNGVSVHQGHNSGGMLFVQRTASNAWFASVYNSAGLTQSTIQSEVSGLLTGMTSFYILAEHGVGGADSFATDQIAAAFIANGTLNPNNTSLRINSFMRAYGINTY